VPSNLINPLIRRIAMNTTIKNLDNTVKKSFIDNCTTKDATTEKTTIRKSLKDGCIIAVVSSVAFKAINYMIFKR